MVLIWCCILLSQRPFMDVAMFEAASFHDHKPIDSSMKEFTADDQVYSPNAHTQMSPPPHLDNEAVDANEDSDWFDLGIVDVEAETESMRQEAEARLRIQSNEIKRFHEKICERVTARERQNRLEAQRAQKYLDTKCAKLFSTTESIQRNTVSVRSSTRSYFQKLNEDKRALLKDCHLGKQIEKSLRLDAQIRNDLLRSTEISRSQDCVSSECANNEGDNLSEPAESPVLLPEQRIALYAAVRRQYMEMNRAKVQRGTSQPPNSNKTKSPLTNTSVAAAVHGSRARRAENSDHNSVAERWGVKVIDMTSGCDVRVHRQTTTLSTPWRKKSTKGPPTQTMTTEHERFLQALQAQLGTPALCSCAKAGPSSISSSPSCANNCALYNQPKKREKLLAKVYKQQQQDMSTAGASPIR